MFGSFMSRSRRVGLTGVATVAIGLTAALGGAAQSGWAGTAGATYPSAGASVSATANTPAAFLARVVALTNTQRKMHGCGALTVNATLNKVAQAHSTDMAVHNYFSHNSKNGATPFDRMRLAGYRYSWAAENIAAGQTSADQVMVAWMRSPGHRANILNCHLTQIGVGYAVNTKSTYQVYWTQDFGTPR
jgi:uncharacterized protein YkwD